MSYMYTGSRLLVWVLSSGDGEREGERGRGRVLLELGVCGYCTCISWFYRVEFGTSGEDEVSPGTPEGVAIANGVTR